MSAEIQTGEPTTRITVVYDNVAHAQGLATAWGFAAVVETGGERVLFDTGGDGPTLLANLRRLEIDPGSIGAVVLSHIHGDHVGGLDDFLAERPGVTVYVPESFPAAFRQRVEARGARAETVGGARRLLGNLHSTGEMGDAVREQALVIDDPAGLIVVTGCAHPGIAAVAGAARAYLGKEVHLLVGGFHLGSRSEGEVQATARALRDLGVRHVAPSHCTGDAATALLRAAWEDDFVASGCGAVIEVPFR